MVKRTTPRAESSAAVEKVDQPIKVASTRADAGPGKALALRPKIAMRAAAGTTHTIRTTMRPDEEITVSETEYQYLFRAGLIYTGTPPAPVVDFYDGEVSDRITNGSATPQALSDAIKSATHPLGVAARAALVPFWAAGEAVVAGAIRIAPDGKTIQRTADGTTGASYDATEQAAWTPVTGADATTTVKGIVELATTTEATAGTDTARAVTPAGVKAVADATKAVTVPRWQPNTAYTAGVFVMNPSGRIVSALADFTSGTTYNPANWANQAALDPLGLGFPVTMDPINATSATDLGAVNRTNYYRVIGGGDISKVGLQVTTSSGNICVAVYRASGTGRGAVPGAQLASSGSVPCPAAGYAEVALGKTVTVAPGDFLAVSADNTTAQFRAGTTVNLPGDLWKGRAMFETAFPAPAAPAPTVALNRSICLVGIP